MAWIYLPGFHGLLYPANPIGMLVGVKLLLLAGTAALVVHARLQLIPQLTEDNVSGDYQEGSPLEVPRSAPHESYSERWSWVVSSCLR